MGLPFLCGLPISRPPSASRQREQHAALPEKRHRTGAVGSSGARGGQSRVAQRGCQEELMRAYMLIFHISKLCTFYRELKEIRAELSP